MTFSYTLFLVLLLRAPGLALWAGLRAGERSDLIAQAPEKPGSTVSLILVVFGALLGHILLASLFVVQAGWCAWSTRCIAVGFDPNVYRVILTNGRSAGRATDLAFLAWLIALLLPAAVVGVLGYQASSWHWLRDLRETMSFGWLKRLVDRARPADQFIMAYVVTTLAHDGAYVAYEGVVENIALDEYRAIKMLVLGRCDRFLVRIEADRVERIDADRAPIPLLQLEASNIVNVALEVFRVPDRPPDATDDG